MSFSDGSISDAAFSGSVEDWNDVEIGSGPVQMGLSVAKNIASGTATARFNWEDGTSSISFAGGYEKFGVATGGATTVPAGGKYTAYAMALPLSNNNAFKGETLNVNIKCAGVENIAFQVPGEKIASVNGSAIYNWIGGKSYTIRINIGFDGAVTGEILDGNVIRVTTDVAQSYTLKYEGADGEPLADYAAICTLPGEHTVEEYLDLIDVNVAPREAATIGIYDSEGVRNGTIQLAGLKPDYSETPAYRFGLLSDVHIGRSGINADQDFANVLSFFESKGTSMTCICGDITQNGTETELSAYKSIVDASNSEVYTTTGNHDCTSFNKGIDESLWQQYTGQQLVFEKSITRNGKVDHFLFLGMTYWYFSAAYQEHHIDWLEDKLEEYRNERCFVITHLFFPDRAGNMNGVYISDNWLTGGQLERLQKLCDRYANSIWFSGHSHWEWSAQQFQDRANIFRAPTDNQVAGWCVHIPACGAPATSSDGTDRGENGSGSEGSIVEVYENHIDILGISLDTASGEYKYLPIATYRLDTTLQTIDETDIDRESHYLREGHFIPYKGTGEFSVTDVDGMENYVDVIFSAGGQGFYVRNETFIENVSKRVAIIVEDITCWTNWDETKGTGTQVNTIANVGFYSGGYNLSSTNACYVNSTHGVQFQTSSSCAGPFNIKIRMKVKMICSPSASAGGDTGDSGDSGDDNGGSSGGDSGDGGDQENSAYICARNISYNKSKNDPDKLSPDALPMFADVPGTDYVDVTFRGTSQGLWVKPDNFPGKGGHVKIIVEEAFVLTSDGSKPSVPQKFGFYAPKILSDGTAEKSYGYYLETLTVGNNHDEGIAFQSKSDSVPYGKIWPMTIRMKVKMEFYE